MDFSATPQSNSRFGAADDMRARGTVQAAGAVLSAAAITGGKVFSVDDEQLGTIRDVMLDIADGKIHYAVLASGRFLGLGGRLFAIPWRALKHDKENKCFVLDMDAERLKNAPGFDKDQWPNMADAKWNSTVESFYSR